MARISSREQESGFSIDAQLNRLQSYAASHDLNIIETYSLVESSTKGTRKKFREVVNRIQRSRVTMALITETVDRLLRNFKDSIVLDELRKEGKVHLHFLRENLILTKESNSADIIRWDIAIMFSKSYILMMTDNILRSMKHKVKQRGIINHLPTGYLHIDKKGVLDPVRSPLIRQLFELYSTGNYSLDMLVDKMAMLGLTSRITGKPFRKATLHAILNNQTYYGIVKAFGEIYTPDIDPIISYDLWQQCQAILHERNLNPGKIKGDDFTLRRAVTCADCGAYISFESKKKGAYIYGHCDNCKVAGRNSAYVKESVLLKLNELKGLESCLVVRSRKEKNDLNPFQQLRKLLILFRPVRGTTLFNVFPDIKIMNGFDDHLRFFRTVITSGFSGQ